MEELNILLKDMERLINFELMVLAVFLFVLITGPKSLMPRWSPASDFDLWILLSSVTLGWQPLAGLLLLSLCSLDDVFILGLRLSERSLMHMMQFSFSSSSSILALVSEEVFLTTFMVGLGGASRFCELRFLITGGCWTGLLLSILTSEVTSSAALSSISRCSSFLRMLCDLSSSSALWPRLRGGGGWAASAASWGSGEVSTDPGSKDWSLDLEKVRWKIWNCRLMLG